VKNDVETHPAFAQNLNFDITGVYSVYRGFPKTSVLGDKPCLSSFLEIRSFFEPKVRKPLVRRLKA
jgi:hypothetical protein